MVHNAHLGYACINTDLQEDNTVKKAERPCVNRSCIEATFIKKGVDHVVGLVRFNLESVLKVLEWNHDHGVYLYRLSSDMFPHITNPKFIKYEEKYAYSLDQFDDLFQEIGAKAREYNIRLTFHPGQFNQVGSNNYLVYRKTITDLTMQAEVLDRMGCDLNSIMVVHGGGTYGDKPSTLKRWVRQFHRMPRRVKRRLVIENCERQYSYLDMLELSKFINRPVIFDTHHHNCYHDVIEELPDPSTFIEEIIDTWTKHGLTPKFHISEQAPDKRIGAHSDYVEIIPDYLLNLVKDGRRIDIMIEAKAKEKAVMHLYKKYHKEFNRDPNTGGELNK